VLTDRGGTLKNPHHILTLVIRRQEDIAGIRVKVKLLARALGCRQIQVARFAVASSETARLLLTDYGGGRMQVCLFPVVLPQKEMDGGLEFFFQGSAGCRQKNGRPCPRSRKMLMGRPPFHGLEKIFAEVVLRGGTRGLGISIRCRSKPLGIGWEKLPARLRTIRDELFKDAGESYLENLRAKHDEVLRLLRDREEQMQLLDRSNRELLQLSSDLEELARERAIFEMSLEIADRMRNPATIIGGLTRQLLKRKDLPVTFLEKLRQIDFQARQMEKIVAGFNLSANQRRQLIRKVDLGQLVREILETSPTIAARRLRPHLEISRNAVFIHANRRMLKIAVSHVLRYLAHGVLSGSRLRIAVVERTGSRLLCLSGPLGGSGDSGDSGRIATAGSQKSTGCDLQLVRQILREHQARLRVTTRSHPAPTLIVVMRFPMFFTEKKRLN